MKITRRILRDFLYLCHVHSYISVFIYRYTYMPFLKTVLLFYKSFKLKIFFQNFISVYTVLWSESRVALSPHPHFPKLLLLSWRVCLFCDHALSIRLGSSAVAPVGSYFLEGGPVPVATPLRPITLLPTSPSKHWLPIAPGEAWVLMNPLLSPIHGGMLMVQSWQGKVSLSSSSWSQTRDSVYYSRGRGILCHHVQLHIIFY